MTETPAKGFRKLHIWEEGHKFVLLIYRLTGQFPKEEEFGLTSQLRRATVSIVANIVEGYARSSRKEYIQFLYIAYGSLAEVEYYLLLSKDLQYFTNTQFEQAEQQRILIGNMLYGLIHSLKTRP